MGRIPVPPPVPPSGPLPPNESRGYIINIVCWTGAAITTIFVLLRLWSRKFLTRTLDWSDAIIVVSQILQIASIALASIAISYGVGRHVVHIRPENITPALYYTNILQPVAIAAFCLPKFSVAILIVSLMGPEKKGAWFLYFNTTTVFVLNALSGIMLFAQCDPPNHPWHPFEPAECYPPIVLLSIGYAGGAWSAFTDLTLAVFPAFLLRNLRMKRAKKIKVIMIMGLGFFAMIAAIVKTTQLSANRSSDASYDLFGLFITTYIECDLVIIAACAPTIPKIFEKMMSKDTERSASKPGYGTRSASRGYQAFDLENQGSQSLAMDAIHQKVVITQHSQLKREET